MPKTKHQRIPDEKKIVSVAQSPVSLQNHHNFTAATKTHKEHFFPPPLTLPRLAGGSGDSSAALGAGRFLAHALSLARRSWCKELKDESNVTT